MRTERLIPPAAVKARGITRSQMRMYSKRESIGARPHVMRGIILDFSNGTDV